jgi:hypothetical protein
MMLVALAALLATIVIVLAASARLSDVSLGTASSTATAPAYSAQSATAPRTIAHPLSPFTVSIGRPFGGKYRVD